MHVARTSQLDTVSFFTKSGTIAALLVSVALLLTGCSSSSTPAEAASGVNDSADSARYRLTFNASWSDATHPLNFPGQAAHFSPLTGVVHNEQVRFWEPGQLATPGIQQVAETGNSFTFGNEVQAAITAGLADTPINGSGIGVSPGATSVEFSVMRSYPQISIITMLAPSPDWFAGLHNYSLLDNGEFVQNATVNLALYDSGTDDGTRYRSPNVPAASAAPIMLLSSDPTDSPFTNGQPFVGTFVIERLP